MSPSTHTINQDLNNRSFVYRYNPEVHQSFPTTQIVHYVLNTCFSSAFRMAEIKRHGPYNTHYSHLMNKWTPFVTQMLEVHYHAPHSTETIHHGSNKCSILVTFRKDCCDPLLFLKYVLQYKVIHNISYV